MISHLFLLLAVSICFCSLGTGTLTPKSPKAGRSSKPKLDKVRVGPQNSPVHARNLVSENPTAKDILQNYQAFFKETDEYSFDGIVLGFVTPWNNHGYDIAKIFGNKFTHISPVWLQIKRLGDLDYEVTGLHDIDEGWSVKVKNAGRERGLKIVPRVLFEEWSGTDYGKLLGDKAEIKSFIKTLITVARKYKFDGYVLEVWPQLGGRVRNDVLHNLVILIGDTLGAEQLDLILVIPPKREEKSIFTPENFDTLYDHVTAFSLMTYDFSSAHRPGPNAPLSWIEDSIESITTDESKRPKILTGFNFYGNDYTENGGGPIVGHEYISRLQDYNGRLKYDTESEEHYFQYKDSVGRHLVFYPTLFSISRRIEMCRDMKTGISIWELGQGLDYFYDLL